MCNENQYSYFIFEVKNGESVWTGVSSISEEKAISSAFESVKQNPAKKLRVFKLLVEITTGQPEITRF